MGYNDQRFIEEIFCYNCGKIIKVKDFSCPYCGVLNRDINITQNILIASIGKNQQRINYPPPLKRKIIAILLAIFLGYWTWLYTYGKNSKKFWIGLILDICLVDIGMSVIYFILFIVVLKSLVAYTLFPIFEILTLITWHIIIRIIAMIDVFTNPNEYYLYYPNFELYDKPVSTTINNEYNNSQKYNNDKKSVLKVLCTNCMGYMPISEDYCKNCGALLKKNCPNCYNILYVEYKYCSYCGYKFN